jgi:hypothetical protein
MKQQLVGESSMPRWSAARVALDTAVATRDPSARGGVSRGG